MWLSVLSHPFCWVKLVTFWFVENTKLFFSTESEESPFPLKIIIGKGQDQITKMLCYLEGASALQCHLQDNPVVSWISLSAYLVWNSFQDYEYAGYNPVTFDIANHFCEMAADYHTETPHVLDYDKYPGGWLAFLVLVLFIKFWT